ncbi:MAG: hypothetical protein ACK5LO_13490 [Leucobacter sp.]
MTNHTTGATATLAGETAIHLCNVCSIAHGHQHFHPLDHLHKHGIDCACNCHEQLVRTAVFGEQIWHVATLFAQRTAEGFTERGPPVALAA